MPLKLSSLSDVEVAQIVAELGPRLAGGHIGKIRDGDQALELEIGRARLLISIHPRASRLHLSVPVAPAAPLPAQSAPARRTPSGFAMLARKRLSGLRLVELKVVAPGERVVALDLGPGRDSLVAELTGPHANVFLLDPDGRIVASLRPSSSTTRPLVPGAIWAPPPAAPLAAKWRGQRRFGDSPGLSERVAEHYASSLLAAAEEEARTRTAVALRREIDHLERRRRALDGDLAHAREAEVFRKYGDLLLAHLREIRAPGSEFAHLLDDFQDGSPIAIPLDPSLDARSNAARYYRQYKRLTGGRRRIEERIALTDTAIAERWATLQRLPALDLVGLRAVSPAAIGQPPPRRTQRPAARLPYREYRTLAGDLVRVGRSAADNDALTFHHARGNDLWFHTRDAPGSHVVVVCRTPEIAEATVIDAATLAAHFSPLRNEPQVDITYTRVKYVRKPRGAAPGLVFLSGGKTIRLRLEPARLERLLTEEPPPDQNGG